MEKFANETLPSLVQPLIDAYVFRLYWLVYEPYVVSVVLIGGMLYVSKKFLDYLKRDWND